jgi:transposase
LTRERSRHVQRLQKTLEDANIKLDSVISDVMGLSGRKMIEALIGGESDPEQLAQLAHRRIKACPGVGRGRRPRSSARRCAAASPGITAFC